MPKGTCLQCSKELQGRQKKYCSNLCWGRHQATFKRKRLFGEDHPNWRGGHSKDITWIKYNNYKAQAKRRGISFDITYDQFMKYWQKACNYCGTGIDTIGIDRIDNSMGYIAENITSCCEICNKMKRVLPVDKFVEHCRKIVQTSHRKGLVENAERHESRETI